MTNLYLRGHRLDTVFQLLGEKEDDITFSVGWALSRSDSFLHVFLKSVFPRLKYGGVTLLRLQDHSPLGGRTDIEIICEKAHCIIEAKRGWSLPSDIQIKKYVSQRKDFKGFDGEKKVVVLSECSAEYCRSRLPDSVEEVTVTHRSWKEVHDLACKAIPNATHREMHLLRELSTYLRSLMTMQNHASNWVYVVSLGLDTPDGWKIGWIDIVEKKGLYFHPVGNKYPKTPPNYIGVRYHGALQGIYHVDSYEVVTVMNNRIPEIPKQESEPYFLYKLGPRIRPDHEVKNGRIYPSGRVWAMLDLLLTCSTISEARDESQVREEKHGGQTPNSE